MEERRKQGDFYFQERYSIENRDYKSNLIGGLLVTASEEGMLLVPKQEEYILSEIVNGTMLKIGEKVELDYKQNRIWDGYGFEIDFFNYFDNKIKNTDKLNTKVRDSIIKLCTPFWVDCSGHPYNRNYLYTEAYELHTETFRSYNNSRIELSVRYVDKIKKALDKFPCEEKKDILEIGNLMKQLMKEDVEHIKKR